MNRSLAAFLSMIFTVITVDAETHDPPVTLRVKPKLCITDTRTRDCETTFVVQWESHRIGHYCLKDDTSEIPLRCWQQESFGSFDEERVVIRNFSYWLTMPGREQPLAEAKVELMTVGSSDRRRNRRNRHAWSIL
jgi:hypothetical protein